MTPERSFTERYGVAVFDVTALALGAVLVAALVGYFAIDLWRLRRTLSRKGRVNAVLLFAAVAGALLMILRACDLNGQPVPTPTPTPTLAAEAKTLLVRLANAITTPFVNWLGSHPVAMLLGMIGILACLGITNGIRRAYPVKRLPTDQPRWATFLLGFADPFVGNFWNLAGWAGKKTHVPVYVPGQEPTSAEPAGPADPTAKKISPEGGP